MKKRAITAIFYVIIMLGVLAMKLFIPTADNGLEYGALGIDALFVFISVCAAYEFTRAVGAHKAEGDKGISTIQRWSTIVTCGLIIPVFVLAKMITIKIANDPTAEPVTDPLGGPALVAMLAVVSLGAMVTASMTVFDHDRSDLKSTAYSLMCILYCGVLIAVVPNINHMEKYSDIATVLLFFTTPAVDTFALFFGMLFGKMLPAKLAPKTSPNKTVIGAVGGIFGGMFAAFLVWLISEFTPILPFEYDGNIPKWLLLMIISIPTSILAQLGDLFESAVKRGCGVKDMGKLLPGHGGVLDRFDSMLFATVPIVVAFMIIR